MKAAFVLFTALMLIMPVSMAISTSYDETALSKLYRITINNDSSITLSKAVNGSMPLEVGKLQGLISVQGNMVLVRDGKFFRKGGDNYVLLKGNFKIDSKDNTFILGHGNDFYAESNDYRASCPDEDCELRISYGGPKRWNTLPDDVKEGTWFEVSKGSAKFESAVAGLEKEASDIRNGLIKSKSTLLNRRTIDSKEMRPFYVNVSKVIIRMPYDSKFRDLFFIYRLPVEGTGGKDSQDTDMYDKFYSGKSRFGWDMFIKGYLWVDVFYNEDYSAGDSYWKPPIQLDIYSYDHFILFSSKLESSLLANYVSFTGYDRTALFNGMNGVALFDKAKDTKYTVLSLSNSPESYESCRSIFSRWKETTCVYFTPENKILRFYDRPEAHNIVTLYPSSGVRFDNLEVKKLILESMSARSNYKVIDKNYAGKWLHANRTSLILEKTNDWKDIGISFTAFIYNPMINGLQRIECDIDTGKCNLDGKLIYDIVKNLKCENDNDCDGKKCVSNRCVAPKTCESLFKGSNGKINILVVATGYPSKAEALSDANNVLDFGGNGDGVFSFEPMKSYKDYFNFYFTESSLAPNSALESSYKRDTGEVRQGCSGINYVLVLDNYNTACKDYCPFSDMNMVQIPMKKSTFKSLPSVTAHEFGHIIGLLDDEYRVSSADEEYRLLKYNNRNIGALNCVPCYRGAGKWLPKTGPYFRSCGGGCRDCSLWCRPSENSIMNNKDKQPGFLIFNDASKKQYEFFIKRRLGLPSSAQDQEVWDMIMTATKGYVPQENTLP